MYEDNKVGGITWNFAKFLVDADGKVVNYYDPTVVPSLIKDDILDVVAKSGAPFFAEEKPEEKVEEETKEETSEAVAAEVIDVKAEEETSEVVEAEVLDDYDGTPSDVESLRDTRP